jgi:hypothetical protein
MNAFFDYSYGRNIPEVNDGASSHFTGVYSSTGLEIYADVNPLRFIFPVRAGLRMGYIIPGKRYFTDFLVSVSTNL